MLVIEYRIKKKKHVKMASIDNMFRRQVLVQFLNNTFKDENAELLDIYMEEDRKKEDTEIKADVVVYQNTGKPSLPDNLKNRVDDFKLRLKDYNSYNL
ncbi:MAG: hypothetical protein KJI71_00635 [Patescibacteria group bacterium]|nr:hypothetical protein [Patescibacteria group bacterium]